MENQVVTADMLERMIRNRIRINVATQLVESANSLDDGPERDFAIDLAGAVVDKAVAENAALKVEFEDRQAGRHN